MPEEVQERFIHGLQQAREAGVLIGFGSDSGATLMIHGQQYRAMYGESKWALLQWRRFRWPRGMLPKSLSRECDLGTVERGKLADLIIVDGKPLDDLRILGRLDGVMKDGVLYRNQKFSPSRR